MIFINRQQIEQELQRLQNDKAFQDAVSNIKAGKFERDQSHKDYKDRIVYTMALRNFLYNPAVLNVIFTDPELKTTFFRTFGYKGKVNFTIYPKCWLRDLPLLDIGENVYLGDNILLGTNLVTTDQKFLLVGKIKIGDNCIFNQGCSLACMTTIGADCIIGFEVGIGFRNTIGEKVTIGERSTIGHGNRIGDKVTIGYLCKIGHSCIIEDGVVLDEMTEVPSNSLVTKDGIYPRQRKLQSIKPVGRALRIAK